MAGRPHNALILTDDERATLLRWTRSRTCSQARALRAQIVLACADEPTNTAVARRLGVSRDMVGTWRARFHVGRLDGLDDQTRPGRPSSLDDDTVAHVLVRTLAAPPGTAKAWSTRSMAAETGLSQSAVSRIWRAYGIRPGTHVAAASPQAWSLPDHAEDVVGLFLAPPLCILAVTAGPGHGAAAYSVGQASGPQFGRDPDLPHVLAVACAFTVLRGNGDPNGRTWKHSTVLRAFLEWAGKATGGGKTVHLLTFGLPALTKGTLEGLNAASSARLRWHHAPGLQAWASEIRRVFARGVRAADALAPRLPLRDALLTWCSTWTYATTPFVWSAAPRPSYDALVICGPGNDSLARTTHTDQHRVTCVAHQSASPGIPPGALATADPIVGRLREALLSGPCQPGRVREAPLATRLGLPRRSVRTALRSLAEEGMLDLLPSGGTAIPVVTAKDVFELYALRATLGAMLIRRVAMLDPADLAPVTEALAEVRTASCGNAHAHISEADQRFQSALARSTDLTQAIHTFERLTARLRLFIEVLHMDYTKAGRLIADEDTAIHDAVLDGDGDEAARLWRVKIERCVRYMVGQLPQDHVAPHLWTALAGMPDPRRGDLRASAP